LTCTLSYIDVEDGVAKTQEGTLSLRRLHDDEGTVDPDVTVEAHRCRLLAARAMEQAAAMLCRASTSDVQAILSEALEALEKSPARTSTENGVQDRIAALINDLSSCLESASDQGSCEKLCSSRAFAHKHQISTRAEGSEYRNALQQSLAEAARREIGLALIQEAPRPLQQVGRVGRKGGFQPPSRASESVSAGTGSITAGAVRVGMRIMCRGQPGTVQDVTMSKTGKHGHAKAFFTVLGDDGVKRQDIVPSSHDVELAPEVATAAALA